MTMLAGHPSQGAVYIPAAMGAPGSISVGGPGNGSPAPGMMIIDGTPVRVVAIAFAAAAGIWALRLAGFKFNVGVSS